MTNDPLGQRDPTGTSAWSVSGSTYNAGGWDPVSTTAGYASPNAGIAPRGAAAQPSPWDGPVANKVYQSAAVMAYSPTLRPATPSGPVMTVAAPQGSKSPIAAFVGSLWDDFTFTLQQDWGGIKALTTALLTTYEGLVIETSDNYAQKILATTTVN